MARRTRHRRLRAGAAALVLSVCFLLACATIESPSGGPVDETPPGLGTVAPDSGSSGLEPFDRLVIEFSEKVVPQPAERMMRFYPPIEVRKTGWHSRREMKVELAEPAPADTVIVVEIMRGLKDVHGVGADASYRFPLATADSIPGGSIAGRLLQDGKPLPGAVVELYPVPPDTVELVMQDILRRTETGPDGRFELEWLPVPGGPWALRAFADANGDLRRGQGEGQRVFPAAVTLAPDAPRVDLEPLTVFGVREPGTVRCGPADPGAWAGSEVLAWPMGVSEEDTGWTPTRGVQRPKGLTVLSAGDSTDISPAGPGEVRLVFFADVDPDSVMGALPDSSAWPDTVTWFWEPYAVVEGIEVEPGLLARTGAPQLPVELLPAPTPPQMVGRRKDAAADSLSAALMDSVTAATRAAADSAAADTVSGRP